MSAGAGSGPVTGSSRAQTLEWRMRWPSVVLYLLPVLLLLPSVLSNTGDAFGPEPSVYDRVFFWSFIPLLAVTVVYGVVLCLRTRVRVTPVGIEVRQFRTRLYRYEDVLDARRNRWANNGIQLVMRNEDRTILPVPTPGRRGVNDSAVEEALAAIRRRGGTG